MNQGIRDFIAIYLTNRARDAHLNTRSNKWIICLKGDTEFVPETVAGLFDNLRLYVPPPHNDLSFECGLWDYVNVQCDTLFDIYENDIIDGNTCLLVATAIDEFLNKNPLPFKKRERVDFIRWMDTLIAFLKDCHLENQPAEIRL